MTGDFAITKRKYMKGFNIETPLPIENANNKTNKLTKRELNSDTKKTITDNVDENLIASIDSKSVTDRIILFATTDKKYFPPDTTKPKKTLTKKNKLT
jgi:hypothetical protein